MSRLFITGGTGYLGSYVLTRLLEDESIDRLYLMSRASSREEGVEKLWKALQLHYSPDQFWEALGRIEIVSGDLHAPGLGISEKKLAMLRTECDSVLHLAASLNRKSNKACFNANLRGTLSVIKLARSIAEARGDLRRFGYVSTTAVSGKRQQETVTEDASVDWSLSDYDPYARTKKFAEHMVGELLEDLPTVIFRPPTVLGDSRFPQTTQFEMVQFYCWMIGAPVVPIHPDTRLDFVPADFVGPAIADLFMKETLGWDIYHLSAGESSKTARQHDETFRAAGIRTPFLMPGLFGAVDGIAGTLANVPRGAVSLAASLMKVFLPYFTNDVVFDNSRVVEELGRGPVPFTEYGVDLFRWAEKTKFQFPYEPLPARTAEDFVQRAAQ